MKRPVTLLVNVPNELYMQVLDLAENQGSCWLQQDKEIDKRFRYSLLSQITNQGSLDVYLYVREIHADHPIRFAAAIDCIQTGDVRRPPPAGPAPEYRDYDRIEGKCSGKDDFLYRTWVRIRAPRMLEVPIALEAFINLRTDQPLKSVAGHTPYYVSLWA